MCPLSLNSVYLVLGKPIGFALLGPAGNPRNTVKILIDGVARALASKDVIDALAHQGMALGYGSP